MHDRLQASGFTHFQQSGTGPIRKDNNYILFLSRVAGAKGIYDLVIAYGQMRCRDQVRLKMLAGGGPIVTTLTGGTGDAVGDTAVIVDPGDIAALAETVDRVVLR